MIALVIEVTNAIVAIVIAIAIIANVIATAIVNVIDLANAIEIAEMNAIVVVAEVTAIANVTATASSAIRWRIASANAADFAEVAADVAVSVVVVDSVADVVAAGDILRRMVCCLSREAGICSNVVAIVVSLSVFASCASITGVYVNLRPVKVLCHSSTSVTYTFTIFFDAISSCLVLIVASICAYHCAVTK